MFVPTLSYSHVAFNGKIAETLISQGHQVTMLLPIIDDQVQYNNSILHIISKPIGISSGLLRYQLWQNPGPFEDSNPLNPRIITKLLRVSNIFIEACEAIAKDISFLQMLKSKRYHIGIVEQYDSCGFGLFNSLGISNVLWLSATGIFSPQPQSFKIHYPLSYAPELFGPISNELNFMDRVVNMLVAFITSGVFSITQSYQSNIFKTDLSLISSKASSILANTHPIFDFAVPTFHQISHLAGISVNLTVSPKLSEYWNNVADSANNGFLLVSFGSIAKTTDMDDKMLGTFLESFVRFPHLLFIMKYEELNCTISLPFNVLFSKWIPQKSLMAHSNYKGIITHGGLSSILESITFGKPMVLMPLFADHFKNANVVALRKVGLIIDKSNLNKEQLMNSIMMITTDEQFSRNCRKISSMLKETRNLLSLENQLKYNIHVSVKKTVRHFSSHLRPKKQLYFQHYDSSFFYLVLLFIFSYTIIYI